MRLFFALPILVLALAASACASDNYDKDIASICNAEALSGANSPDASDKATVMAMWLKDNLKSKRSIELMQSLAYMPPEARKETLNAEAVKAGLTSCPMADAE